MQYYGNSTRPGAQTPFNFGLLTVDPNKYLESINYRIELWLTNMPNGTVANWVVRILK